MPSRHCLYSSDVRNFDSRYPIKISQVVHKWTLNYRNVKLRSHVVFRALQINVCCRDAVSTKTIFLEHFEMSQVITLL